MKKYIIFALFLICACNNTKNLKPAQKIEYGNLQQMIEMQNLVTREVVFCMKDAQQTAEECANLFEKRGFVRLREIPYKAAKYDILKTDSYPTRRWREGEITPRW